MKFAIVKEHRNFFRKNQRIEFDSLLSFDQCGKFIEALSSVLSHRMNVSKHQPSVSHSERAYLAGRDLWRDSPYIKKTILKASFAEIASDITEIKPLRIGYDQLIPPDPLPSGMTALPNQLCTISCIQGIACGLMLCIATPKQTDENASITNDSGVFPLKLGNGIFFSTDCPIDFAAKPFGYTYVMVAYAKSNAVYYRQEADLHTHFLKALGYNFGDVLSIKHHPILFN